LQTRLVVGTRKADAQRHRRAPKTRNFQRTRERIAQKTRRTEPALYVGRRHAQTIAQVHLAERQPQPLGAPVFDQIVDHLEVARIKHDACRIAMLEAHQQRLHESVRANFCARHSRLLPYLLGALQRATTHDNASIRITAPSAAA
jgi:hypothetical protein